MLRKEIKEFVLVDKCVALVELTKIKGSSPREVGSWMLVSSDKTFNTIGGGSLEFFLISQARKILEKGSNTSKVFTSKLSPAIDQCCGGIVEARVSLIDNKGHERLERRIKNEEAQYQNLYLFGAGHVGKAVIKLAVTLPLKITVTDSRIEVMEDLQDRLKDYSENIKYNLDAFPERIISTAVKNSAFLVMTHSHATDFNVVEEILRKTKPAYLGMIGSVTKKLTIKNHLLSKSFCEEDISLITCPIGKKIKLQHQKKPEVIAALVISDILGSFGE